MTTVLTVEPLGGPLFGGTMHKNFSGAITTGRAVHAVKYPASPQPDSIDRGVAALQDAIKTVDGPLLVFAHSQGAQVVSRWLRTHAGKIGAPNPNRVEFLLIGNPLRKYGGYGVGRKEFGGLNGLPTLSDTAYRVTDVKLQYDGWADHPTKPGRWAALNAATDRYGILGNRAIHAMGYRTANLADAGRTSYREGQTEYVMLPHPPLLKIPAAWIETSYQRPETAA